MKAIVHAVIPLHILIDINSQGIESATAHLDEFVYEDPPYVTDQEGGPVSRLIADVALNAVFMANEDVWLPLTRVRFDPELTPPNPPGQPETIGVYPNHTHEEA